MGLAHGIGNGFLKYPTVIDSLAAQNYTQSKLFSLDLGGQVPSGRELLTFSLLLCSRHLVWYTCKDGSTVTDSFDKKVAKTGQLVFGGVDRNKYSGNLRKVPTDPRDA